MGSLKTLRAVGDAVDIKGPFRDVGIWLVGGVDDLIDNPAPWVGARAVLYDDDFRNLIGLASFGR